jgi:protein-tyrosine phosphatase
VLTAVGARPATIMQDYLLSNRFFHPAPRADDVVPSEIRQAITKVQPSYLESAFAAMTEGWGGADGYLENALGIGPRERAALRVAIA